MGRKVVLLVLVSVLLFSVFGVFDVGVVGGGGTIYIRADGSIDPPTANITSVDNVTYTFTDNIYDSIVVERVNIVVDGAGYTVQGTGAEASIGIDVTGNVTIKNARIINFFYGIYAYNNVTISGNNITNNEYYGIMLYSSNNTVSGNNISNNNMVGVRVDGSYNTLSRNNVSFNSYGFWLFGDNNTLFGNEALSDDIGIVLQGSSYNILSGNDASYNGYGIYLETSSYNILSANNASNNSFGIRLESLNNNNVLSNNTVSNNLSGIYIINWSDNNIIEENTAVNNDYGILVWTSSGNNISRNNIKNNLDCGIKLGHRGDNKIFHNNLIDNAQQASNEYGSINVWDDSYPSGGNYWSNYTGVDQYSGLHQNETGIDGIGDSSHVIDANNTDYYPLVHPYGSVRNLDTSLIYLTIQSAIDAPETLNGHTIFVEEGTYYENIVVDKSLSLIGTDRFNTIIDGNLTGDVVRITANNVIITGFTIQNSGPDPSCGIYVSSSDNNISHNIIINNHFGVRLFVGPNDNSIYGNTLMNNTFGVHLEWSSDNTIIENNITNNTYGIRLGNSNNNVVSGNNITYGDFGVHISSSSSNNTFYENNVTENSEYGIVIFGVNNNTFFHNNFIENTQQVYMHGTGYTNLWDDDYPSGGNYWNDYAGNDLYSGTYQNETDSDGIGDTPYTIDADNTDRYPLMGPFGPLTMKGENVTVMPTKEVRIIYEEVLEPGLTLAEEKEASDQAAKKIAEKKYKFARKDKKCLEIKTTAKIAQESKIKIIKRYKPEALEEAVAPEELRLMRWEEATEEWEDVTKRVDTIAEMIIAETVKRSIFALVVPIHDINVTEVTPSKNIVGQGFTMSINATFTNEGGSSETFNVTAYANTTLIETLTNITLTSENSTTVTFTWNTTGVAKGNYTITAKATILPSETDTTDNTLTDGWIIIAMIGDITGPEGYPDGKCDMRDIGTIAKLFGVNHPNPKYDPNCDINDDLKIDMKDIGVIAKNFGKTDP